MTTEVSTNIVKINFKDIAENSTNKRYWTKRWKIFEYNNLEFVVTLDSIDINGDRVLLRLNSKFNPEKYPNLENYYLDDYEYLRVPINQYNEKTLKTQLLRKAHEIVSYYERLIARTTQEYDDLVELSKERSNDHRNDLIAHLDAEGVTDEGIRDAYLRQNYKSFDEDVNDYVSSFEHNELVDIHRMVDILIEVEGCRL